MAVMGKAVRKSRWRAIGGTEKATRIGTAVVGAVLTIGAGLVASTSWPLLSLSYDLPFLLSHGKIHESVCLVEIDELAEGEEKILSRKRQAKLLDRLGKAGARAVIYDIVFKDSQPEIDDEFAKAIRRFRMTDAMGHPLPEDARRGVYLAAARYHSKVEGVEMEEIVTSTDALMLAAEDKFGLTAYEDDVLMARKLTTGTEQYASLAWVAARELEEGLEDSDRLAERWINYPSAPPLAIPRYKASILAEQPFNPELFRDRIVVIGAERGIVGDALGEENFIAPHHRIYSAKRVPYLSGPELQALMLNNLLLGNWLTRSSERFDFYFVIGLGLLFGVALAIFKPFRALLIALVAVLLLVACGYLSTRIAHAWIPWSVVAFVQVPIALVWGSGAQFYVERFFRLRADEEQRAMREAFSKYVSPQMLDQLAEQGFNVKLGGEKVKAAMMFTDLENFTDMCERVENPHWVVATLNDYFERTTSHIFDHDGVVISFAGDAIFAAWGAPLPDPDAPNRAARAAWDLLLSAKLIAGGEELRTRVGVHFGEVVAGNMGSSQHIDYTLIGDAANLASRLEGLNRILGTSILLSDEIVRELTGEFFTRRVGVFRVKGRKGLTVVHELVGPSRDLAKPEWIESYESALEALQGNDFERARELFETVEASRNKGDGPSRFHLEALAKGDISKEGVVTSTVK